MLLRKLAVLNLKEKKKRHDVGVPTFKLPPKLKLVYDTLNMIIDHVGI